MEERKDLLGLLGAGAVVSGIFLWVTLHSAYNEGPGDLWWRIPIVNAAWWSGFYAGMAAIAVAVFGVAFWRLARRK